MLQVVKWLKENENLILPVWMRRVKQESTKSKRRVETRELKHHVFVLYYDRLCTALETDETDELEQMLHKLVDEHTRQHYDVRQILQFPLQLRATMWQFLLKDFPVRQAIEMMERADQLLDHSAGVLVEFYTEINQAALNEQIQDFDFLTQRLALASEETERAFMQLRSLYAVSKAINSTLEIQETLEVIADNLVQLEPIEYCVIWQLYPDNTLRAATSVGQVNEALLDVVLELEPPKSFVSRALATQDRQPFAADGDALARYLKRSDAVAFPMFNEKRPIGVIMTNGQYQGRPFDSAIISLIQSASEQAAVALENAQLYGQVTRFNQELESMVSQRTQELEAANLELERVNLDLERLDKTKSDFISIAAHELKTPLTLIQGYTNIMSGDSLVQNNPFLTNLLQGIVKGSQRLYDIIESMIDVSMIDSEVLQLRPVQTSLVNVIQVLVQQYAEAIQERNLKLTVGRIKSLPYIEADTKRLHQVFDNLLTNAIKYTPDGGKIEIDAWVIDQVVGEEWVEVIVRDTGIGIDPDDQDRIFEKFYQTGELALHSSGKTKFKGGGPGLGLAIAKGIVQAHGGRIWAESPGHNEERLLGSTFHVVLPVKSKIKIANIVSPFSYSSAPNSS